MGSRGAWILAILLAVAAGVRLHWFTGLQMGDDIVYSKIAADRNSGTVHHFNVHQTRSGFLLPLTASYALFGRGEFPLVLYNLLCSIALVGALFVLAGRLFGERAATSAGALAALHPNLVRFATECHTDTPVALWLTLAVAALIAAETSSRPRPLLVLSGLLVGWAWLHKEHAVFVFLFVAGHWIATRRPWTWYLPLGLAFAGVFAVELGSFALQTGNPFKRFEMIRYWHAGQYMAEQYPTSAAVLWRLFLDLPLKLLAPWNGLLFPAGLLAGIVLVRRRTPRARWIGAWFLALYLGYCFWPSSLFPFRPGFSLYQWTFPVLWPPLILLAAAALSRMRSGLSSSLLILLSAAHVTAIQATWTHDRRFADGPREARAWLLHEPAVRVFADDKTVEALDFFDGHDPSRHYIRFQDDEPLRDGVLIVDRVLTEPGRWWSRPVRAEVVSLPTGWRKVYESPRLVIYRLGGRAKQPG